MEPTSKERELQRTAKLLIYVRERTGQPIEDWVVETANDQYAWRDDVVMYLCQALKYMPKDQQEQIIYNAHDKTSRDLANWWDKHQEADRTREAQERRDARKEVLREKALAKLTKDERKALDLN